MPLLILFRVFRMLLLCPALPMLKIDKYLLVGHILCLLVLVLVSLSKVGCLRERNLRGISWLRIICNACHLVNSALMILTEVDLMSIISHLYVIINLVSGPQHYLVQLLLLSSILINITIFDPFHRFVSLFEVKKEPRMIHMIEFWLWFWRCLNYGFIIYGLKCALFWFSIIASVALHPIVEVLIRNVLRLVHNGIAALDVHYVLNLHWYCWRRVVEYIKIRLDILSIFLSITSIRNIIVELRYRVHISVVLFLLEGRMSIFLRSGHSSWLLNHTPLLPSNSFKSRICRLY